MPKKAKLSSGRTRKNPLKSLGAILLIWQFLVFQTFGPFSISAAFAAEDSGGASVSAETGEAGDSEDPADSKDSDSEDEEEEPSASESEEDEDEEETNESEEADSAENEDDAEEDVEDEDEDPVQNAGETSQDSESSEQENEEEEETESESETVISAKDPDSNPAGETEDPAVGSESDGETEEVEGELESRSACDFDGEEQTLFESEGEEYDECRNLPSCSEMKECFAKFKIVIVQENLVEDSENNSTAVSDTGGNSIVQESDPDADGNSDEDGEDPEEEENGSECDCQNPDCENPELYGEARIESGDAVSVVNAVNQVNTNIVAENGGEIIQNIEGESSEDVNLLEIFENVVENANELNFDNREAFQIIEVKNENTAFLVNNAVAEAGTGENSIEGSFGSAEIETGNASAFLNAVNLVNQNIVGANWLLAIVNVFGNWSGDLIVPGEGLFSFFENAGFAIGDVSQENYAEVSNNAVAQARTGDDSIEGNSQNAQIVTGNADSRVNAVNMVNTNIVKNNWFFLMINNMGSWVGQAVNWNGETGQGNNVFSFDFGTMAGGDENALPSGIVNVSSKNTAYVENNGMALADTGGNSISGESGDVSIKTGNATAWANVFNFINTNIVGSNWMMGIVNVMGNWTGDVVFGYPDLSVSMSADKEKVRPGETFSYIVSCRNNGEAGSENIDLRLVLPEFAVFRSDSSGSTPHFSDGGYNWTFSGFEAGEEKKFRVDVLADPEIAAEVASLESVAGIKTDIEEKNLDNNVASAAVMVEPLAFAGAGIESGEPQITVSSTNEGIEGPAELSIFRGDESSGPFSIGDIVDREIVIENTGGETLREIEIKEKIKMPSGEEAAEFSWTVEELQSGQNAVVEYQLSFSSGAQSGKYKCVASAFGKDEAGEKVKAGKASSSFKIEAEEFAYYQQYPQYPSGVETGGGEGIVEAAQASEIPEEGKVLGWQRNVFCKSLPWWGWGAAAILYFTTVHWALLKQKEVVKPVRVKK